jgi:hypothetical protein
MYQYTKSTVAMWLLGVGARKDESESSKHSVNHRGSKRSNTKGNIIDDANQKYRRRTRRDNHGGKVDREKDSYNSKTTDRSMHMLDETFSGIEVSLSHDNDDAAAPGTTPSPTESSFSGNGIILLQQQVTELSRTYRAQYNPTGDKDQSSQPKQQRQAPIFESRNHRIPLFKTEREKPAMLFDDVLFLLRSYEVVDELTCVKDELSLMDLEMTAIRSDREDITEMVDKDDLDDPLTGSITPSIFSKMGFRSWDTHRQLLVRTASNSIQHESFSHMMRSQLQNERGLNFTVSIRNPKALESLMSKCGCKVSFLSQIIGSSSNSDVTLISPQSCRDGGAGATIQHLELISVPLNDSDAVKTPSFVLTRDNAKSYHYERLPEHLFRRMENQGESSHYADNLIYLSTGPLGSYYAEFRNGEQWWGSAFRDDNFEFDTICRDWDIHRVVFGPLTFFDSGREEHSKQFLTTSWIILARDGKVAWKNVPVRLHNKLSNRLASESAPIEVSLGFGGAYFIRFLDGTTKE